MTSSPKPDPSTSSKENAVISLPSLDRTALRQAAASKTDAVVLAFGLLLVVAGVYFGPLWAALEGAVLVALALAGYVFSYWIAEHRRRRAAEDEVRLAEIVRPRNEQDVLVAAEVAAGLRCPDDCAGCAAEAREARERVAEYLRERAILHGHGAA